MTDKRPAGDPARMFLAAMIDCALDDAERGPYQHRASAWRYLAGPDYQHHLECLDLPRGTLPRVIEHAAAKEKRSEGQSR